jgi:hypothetical protein
VILRIAQDDNNLSLDQFPTVDDDLSAGGQIAEFVSNNGFFRNRGRIPFSGKDFEFFESMTATPQFSFTFASSHVITPKLLNFIPLAAHTGGVGNGLMPHYGLNMSL